MKNERTTRIVFLLCLIIFLFIIIRTCGCEKIKLERVSFDKESIKGVIKNKIKKFSESKLVLVTNIQNLLQTHGDFLQILRGGEDGRGHQIGKFAQIGHRSGSSGSRGNSRSGSSDSSDNSGNSNCMANWEECELHPSDQAMFDGLVIILNVLDDNVMEYININYVKGFLEKKKNIFLSVNSVIGKSGMHFLNQLNVNVYGNMSYVIDSFNQSLPNVQKNSHDGRKITIGEVEHSFYTSEIIQNTPIFSHHVISNSSMFIPVHASKIKRILFKGTAHSILLKKKYFLELVTCTKNCLLFDKNDKFRKKYNKGTDLLLVSGIQLENNSRFIFSSSTEIFSNLFFQLNEENKIFSQDIILWNFKKIGIIRYNNFKLHKIENKKEENFFVNDLIHMSIDLYELKNDFWVPFKKDDVQFDVIKLKVNRRNFLNIYKGIDNPTYYKNFQLPTEHGVYKIQIYYLRKGYNILNLNYFLTVRSPLHYEKNKKVHFPFYPFYFYIYMSLFSFFLFILILLFDHWGSCEKSTHPYKNKVE
ncbi:dolichyl-diphosphooligosaccharide--protein glycosyltransferase [Plasmodium gonderi]|uniref:Dolichyl-diphosphooligosaccharide--protein glycosyltransferase 48 kDa subunit n=1 Tax=Plasmodium gonderi TaxID=77519 RepID=A0A1Y1JCL8_PLAGO|nr:dolichyl-diphosphooligosaccharide--protein glycosyltransferase [Plasmodium gonderi]GAW80259.1 dolichyl-diphosphooligosaccharide--protein glycosyltransferase [Plasmodium gonderi]